MVSAARPPSARHPHIYTPETRAPGTAGPQQAPGTLSLQPLMCKRYPHPTRPRATRAAQDTPWWEPAHLAWGPQPGPAPCPRPWGDTVPNANMLPSHLRGPGERPWVSCAPASLLNAGAPRQATTQFLLRVGGPGNDANAETLECKAAPSLVNRLPRRGRRVSRAGTEGPLGMEHFPAPAQHWKVTLQAQGTSRPRSLTPHSARPADGQQGWRLLPARCQPRPREDRGRTACPGRTHTAMVRGEHSHRQAGHQPAGRAGSNKLFTDLQGL